MKNKDLWRKILIGMDIACTVAAFVFLTYAVRMESPAYDPGFEPRLGLVIVMGAHFAIQGAMNWKEHRWTAIFELVVMALILFLGVPRFLG